MPSRIVSLLVYVCLSASVAVSLHGAEFSPPRNYAVGNFPMSIVAGDFNRDGLVDLAIANFCNDSSCILGSGPGSVTVLLNQGDGKYSASAAYQVAVRFSV